MYNGGVAKLTITVPDELLRRARERAAREGTSVTSVLRMELARYVDDDAEVEVGAAWDHFVELAGQTSGRSLAGGRTWRREELQRGLGARP